MVDVWSTLVSKDRFDPANETLTRCCFNVEPTSETAGQQSNNISCVLGEVGLSCPHPVSQ